MYQNLHQHYSVLACSITRKVKYRKWRSFTALAQSWKFFYNNYERSPKFLHLKDAEYLQALQNTSNKAVHRVCLEADKYVL